jgi:hypothetical protein
MSFRVFEVTGQYGPPRQGLRVRFDSPAVYVEGVDDVKKRKR